MLRCASLLRASVIYSRGAATCLAHRRLSSISNTYSRPRVNAGSRRVGVCYTCGRGVSFVQVAGSSFWTFHFPDGCSLSNQDLTESLGNHIRGSHQQDHREGSTDAVFQVSPGVAFGGGGCGVPFPTPLLCPALLCCSFPPPFALLSFLIWGLFVSQTARHSRPGSRREHFFPALGLESLFSFIWL
jgi:hypothetical protein